MSSASAAQRGSGTSESEHTAPESEAALRSEEQSGSKGLVRRPSCLVRVAARRNRRSPPDASSSSSHRRQRSHETCGSEREHPRRDPGGDRARDHQADDSEEGRRQRRDRTPANAPSCATTTTAPPARPSRRRPTSCSRKADLVIQIHPPTMAQIAKLREGSTAHQPALPAHERRSVRSPRGAPRHGHLART